MSDNEVAKFGLSVLTELKSRSVQDVMIACVDDLKGPPGAIVVEYPQTWIQWCLVHTVRNSLCYVAWKDYRGVTRDLKRIYQSLTKTRRSLSWNGLVARGMACIRRLRNRGRLIGRICGRSMNTRLKSAKRLIRPRSLNRSIASIAQPRTAARSSPATARRAR